MKALPLSPVPAVDWAKSCACSQQRRRHARSRSAETCVSAVSGPTTPQDIFQAGWPMAWFPAYDPCAPRMHAWMSMGVIDTDRHQVPEGTPAIAWHTMGRGTSAPMARILGLL